MNDLVRKFLEANRVVDTDPSGGKKKKAEKTVEKHEEESNIGMIVRTKPSKKVVMEFLKDEVARLMDEDSD